MKPGEKPRVGIVDALTAGLTEAGRRPWLILLPALIDLGLWLAPQISIKPLAQRLLVEWESWFRTAYPSEQLARLSDMRALVEEALTQIGEQVNLAELLSGSWIALPSAVAAEGGSRLTFVSDLILAPFGMGLSVPRMIASPWRAAPIEIGSLGIIFLIVVALWLIGQALAAFYVRWAAAWWAADLAQATQRATPGGPAATTNASADAAPAAARPGLLRLTARLILLGLFLGLLLFLLRLPLGIATTLMAVSGNAVTGVVFALIGGMTLWVMLWSLASFFFAAEAILLDGHPLLPSIWQSLLVVRNSGLSTIGMALVINIIMLGFRAVWSVVGTTAVGAILAIFFNAYLGTGMLLAVFAYYGELRQRWQAVVASRQGANRQVDK